MSKRQLTFSCIQCVKNTDKKKFSKKAAMLWFIGAKEKEKVLMREKMWYRSPASGWINSLLIGTGRISGSVFGSGDGERLGLNHEKLYSAKYKDRDFNPETARYLPEIRQLLKQGKYQEATSLSMRAIPDAGKGGEDQRTDDFKPAGELVIVPDVIENRDYRRSLDLDTATAEVRYDGVIYEYAADSVHDRIFVHIKGALSARLDLEFRQDEELQYKIIRTPHCVRAIGEYMVGSFFETRIEVYTDGSFDGSRLTVCREALVVIDIETGLDGEEAIAEAHGRWINNGSIAKCQGTFTADMADDILRRNFLVK